MKAKLILFSILSFQAHAELYRCETSSGQVQFTDQPCPNSGSSYQPKAIMTDYKTVKLPKYQGHRPSIKKRQNCPFLSSTEIRNLRVKSQFKKGLTQENIQQRLGKADDTSNHKDNSTWVYKGQYVKRTFQFKHGCLISWKERWKGKESQISKYRDEP